MFEGRPFGRYALAVLLTTAGVGVPCVAQMHHVDAPERVTRAVGVFEWTGELDKPTASRFVPVSLFINGQFEDAGLYLARPVPFALQPGDVYALEEAGEPQGLLDLDLAKRVVSGNALKDDDPEGTWYGYGNFKPEAAPPPPPKLHASTHLSRIEQSGGVKNSGMEAASNDGKPHLGRRDGGQGSSGADGGAAQGAGQDSKQGSASGSGTGSSDGGSADDDQDRPTLRRRDPAQDAERKRAYGKNGKQQASVTAAGPALGDDPDRPILGRTPEAATGPAELTGLPADMHQAVAVSDAAHSETHPFARAWESPAEKAETLAAMERLARPKVLAYLAANGLAPSSAPIGMLVAGQAAGVPVKPATVVGSGTESADGSPPKLQRGVPKDYAAEQALGRAGEQAGAKAQGGAGLRATKAGATKAGSPKEAHEPPAALVFEQPEVSGFLLNYGGLPTFVFTAATATQNTKVAEGMPEGLTHPVAYVTVVAQRLPSGNLQVNLLAVTDSTHLDRGPRLRLIDAVDPDDSHRASLLFELRGATSRQFALYRLTAVQAEQTFATASIE